MKPIALLPRSNEPGPIFARPLRIHVSDAATCIIARRGLIAEGLLTSIEDETLEIDVYGGEHCTAWLTRDNPFLTEAQRGLLDERGVIRVGMTVALDDVLVSLLETDLPKPGRTTRPGMVWVTDNSPPTKRHWRGATVMECHVLGRRELGAKLPQNVRQRVCVRLKLEHPLAVGDVLVTVESKPHNSAAHSSDDDATGEVLGVVGAILEDNHMPLGKEGIRADLIVPAAAAQRRASQLNDISLIGKAPMSGAQFCQARAKGVYSLITQQPLSGKWGKWGSGQKVSVAQIGWLLSRSMRANIGELVSLKSDDIGHRAAVDTLIRTGKPTLEAVPAPGMPETLNVIRSELMALGLVVTLEDAQGAVALTLRPATRDEIVANSRGAIRKPETLNYRTLLGVEEGLFCPKVFGSDDQVRRQRWGHFDLSAPVVSPLWRVGSPSILERLLGWTEEQIDALLNHEIWVHEVDGAWQTVAPLGQSEKSTGQEPEPGHLTGAVAVEAMLKTVPPERVPPGLRGRAESLALRAVPVLPPDIRPLVLLDSGNFATSDLNDLYRRLINCSNRLAKLEELKAPPQIIWYERRELQRATDTLWANCMVPRQMAVLGSANRRLKDCLELVVQRLLEEDSKRVEWCGRARAVALTDVPANRLRVPREIFETLLLDTEQPVLLTTAEGDGRFIALLPEAHEQPVFAMALLTYERLGLDGVARHACIIHRPLGVQACAEARRLLEGDPGESFQIVAPKTWIDATEFDDMVAGLVEAALNEERVVFDSPRGMLLAGTGCVDLVADTESPVKPVPLLEVPKPTEEPPLTGAVLRDRINEVLGTCKRKACVFRLTAVDKEPAVGVGHVGGLPDLPPGVEWPEGRDGRLTFLAQLPLDAARDAGLLPIDVAPGSLLTIFEPPIDGSADDAVFIVSSNAKLTRREPPAGVHTHPWCLLQSEIVEELPSLEETVDLLKAELGPITAKDLYQFKTNEWPKYPGATNAIKLGGWPKWIQSPENDTPLLAQIVSNDEADMCFVDTGSLYVFANAENGYDVVCQYY